MACGCRCCRICQRFLHVKNISLQHLLQVSVQRREQLWISVVVVLYLLIIDRGCLVLWADDPREILDRASKLVNEIVMLIWEDGLETDELNEKKGEVIVSSVEKDSASSDVDVEQGFIPSIRRRVAWQPLTVGATMTLLFLSTGTGYGQIVEEIYYDRIYARLLLILVMPMQLWVSLVRPCHTLTQCLYTNICKSSSSNLWFVACFK